MLRFCTFFIIPKNIILNFMFWLWEISDTHSQSFRHHEVLYDLEMDVQLYKEAGAGRVGACKLGSQLPANVTSDYVTKYHFTRMRLLLLPRERWRSIVMSTSVCLCVCMSVCLSESISPETHAQSLPNVWCLLPVAMDRSFSGEISDEIRPKGNGQFSFLGGGGLVLLHWQCIVQRSIWDPYSN